MAHSDTHDCSADAELVASLQTQLDDARSQLEHMQGVATICELTKQEAIGDVQQRCQEELASLQAVMKDTVSQYENRIAALQSELRRVVGRQNNEKGSVKKELQSAAGKGGQESGGTPRRRETGAQGETRTVVQTETGRGSALSEAQVDGRTEGQSASEPQPQPEGESPGGKGLEAGAGAGGEEELPDSGESEGEGGGLGEGYFSQNCDTTSLSSFSMDTPSLSRRPPPQDDTASLVSTGTLVPEAIYLPPPGHRLVPHSDWESVNAQVLELKVELARVREEKSELERELDSTTTETASQISTLQSQVQMSESLLQELQKSFSQSQSTVQGRLAELSLSQQKVCSELSRLSHENRFLRKGEGETVGPVLPSPLQGVHSEERLRIEIVNLKEQLETRTEESVQLSSLKTETDRIQRHNDQLQTELQGCRTELCGLRVALSHLQKDVKTHISEKEQLQQQYLEQRSKVIRLKTELDTSQAVQRDFVCLSQSLQVRLEQVRQAQTLEQVKEVLDGGTLSDITKPKEA
ncbi:rab GTPase-binding effector protein 2 isoform X2 [Amia ocellicauda]|uniref:rab GTPase-binding effector protein 2 isoform X2 n=1 Tax=Amia ocellicauda TaxID=2972642 RepID=UPI0034639900